MAVSGFRYDDGPTAPAPVDTAEEARRFPERTFLELRPPRWAHLVGLVIGVALAAAAVAVVVRTVEIPPAVQGGGVLVGMVLAAVNWARGHWLAYAVAISALMAGTPWLEPKSAELVIGVLLLTGAGVVTWRYERARAAKWHRMAGLLTDHRPVDAVVTLVAVDPGRSNNLGSGIHVTVESRTQPVRSWLVSGTQTVRFRPIIGDEVVVWHHGPDPAVAVVCVPRQPWRAQGGGPLPDHVEPER